MKGWNIAYGKGAYMAAGFNKLMEASQDEKDNADDVSKEWTQEATLEEVAWDNRNFATRTKEINLAEIQKLTEYSFSFWHRFSYNDPKKVDIQ